MNLKADWRLFQLALFNILQNAVKFNLNKGSINVDLSIRKDEFDASLNILETIITDSGIGIEDEIIPTLFEPFGKLR